MPHVTDEQWLTLLSYARRQFVYDLVMGSVYHAREIWERMKLLDITSMPRVVLSLRMENYYALTYDKSERWKHIFREDVLSFLHKILPDDLLFVPFSDNMIVLMAPFPSLSQEVEREAIAKDLKLWAKDIFDSLGLNVVFGVGCVYKDPRLLHFSFQESLQALRSLAEEDVAFADGIGEGLQARSNPVYEDAGGVRVKPDWPEDVAKSVARRLDQGDYSGALAQLVSGLEAGTLQTSASAATTDRNIAAIELALAVLKEAFPDNRRELALEALPDFFKETMSIGMSDPLSRLLGFGEKLIRWQEHYGPRENPKVAYIKAYVNEHLEGDLALTRVAKVVHLVPAYLSQLFKKVTGENFSDYVSGQRLSKACQLLQSTSLSVREVAQRVGFQDVNYFTRAFKQHFQKTPGEFRKGQ